MLSDDWDYQDDHKAIPEIITIIPLIKNVFGLDVAEVKNNLKMFTSRIGAIWN